MYISFHGGLCCGIKHIHELGRDPNAEVGPIKARVFKGPDWTHDKQMNPDQWGQPVSSDVNCYYLEAPKETHLERLDRYLAFLDDWRPNGIVETVLCDYASCWAPEEYTQIAPWEDLLFERDFKLVNSCYNSNSKNRIFVYHRTTDKEED